MITLLLYITSNAQTAAFEDISKVETRNVGYILEQDNLVGYYAFYKTDKADKKNDNYVVRILDNNLTPQKSIEVTRLWGTNLLENVFNGNAFMMAFFRKDEI